MIRIDFMNASESIYGSGQKLLGSLNNILTPGNSRRTSSRLFSFSNHEFHTGAPKGGVRCWLLWRACYGGEARIGQVDADKKQQGGVAIRMLFVTKPDDEDLRFCLR
jgi:hypothetical protein